METLADVVRLNTGAVNNLLDEASSLIIEEHVLRSWAHRPTGSSETSNVVVGGGACRSSTVALGYAIRLRNRGACHWGTVGSRGRHDGGRWWWMMMDELRERGRNRRLRG